MNRKLVIAVAAVLLLGLSTQVFAQYNRDAVVKVMRSNVALMGAINTAVGNKDFFAAAAKLMELAQGEKSLVGAPVPKGSQAEWDRIHSELVLAAFRAIGACGEQNVDKLKAELAAIGALNKEGHSKFRG